MIHTQYGKAQGDPCKFIRQKSFVSLIICLQSLLERLAAGPVIGDGGFIFALEKRGYCKAGPWTPEATVEHPEAVRQLHKEFLRAGTNTY